MKKEAKPFLIIVLALAVLSNLIQWDETNPGVEFNDWRKTSLIPIIPLEFEEEEGFTSDSTFCYKGESVKHHNNLEIKHYQKDIIIREDKIVFERDFFQIASNNSIFVLKSTISDSTICSVWFKSKTENINYLDSLKDQTIISVLDSLRR